MPSDKPDDMDNPAFSPRQLGELDKRFEAVDKRFEAVDKRFEAVDKRFEAVDKRFEAVDKRFDEVERRADERERRLRADVRADAQQIAGTVMEYFDVQLRLALEPTRDVEKRVEALDDERLPERVTKLELAVVPPPGKPARRRRG